MKDTPRILAALSLAFLIMAAGMQIVGAQQPFDHTVIVNAPAVAMSGGERIGVISEMQVSVSEGDGSIFVETWPLSELDTQASARLAVAVAQTVTGIDVSSYNIYYSILSSAPVVGGPSAGAILTVATIACLNGWDVDPTVMMTGMINPDGTVGPVGGIYEKAEAAHKEGISLFLVPQGQSVVTVDDRVVDLRSYAPEAWGMEVREVLSITEAVTAFTGYAYDEDSFGGDIVADTTFYADDVQVELVEAERMHRELNTRLFDAPLPTDIYRDLTSYMVSSAQRVEDAVAAVDAGRHYTAMSYLFQARISLSYVEFALHYFEAEDRQMALDDVVGEIERDLSDLDIAVSAMSESIYGFAMLDAFAAAQERSFEAQEHLAQAKRYRVWNEPANAMYSCALARERARTSWFWLSIAERYAEGERIAITDVQYDAYTLLNDANLIFIYVSEMVSGSELLSDAQELLAIAQDQYDSGDYAASLYNAIESRTLASLAIELYSCGEASVERMALARQQAAAAIERQVANGIVPLLSMSYYEFASVYEEADTCVQATLYYKYASGVANAFRYLASGFAQAPAYSQRGSGGTGLPVAAISGLVGLMAGSVGTLAVIKRRQRNVYKERIE
ncbi:MAG: hypothetical protein PHW58_04555 [Candidatus Methanofastidiosa archaeon]|nr:hypothetical protein [Candidatus Methanofastidiosa archaeon]MDD4281484.1 hypothetical protein [Candidatus Methanofastidiosa archaeon]